jgi:Plasmid pRiA4b ORF-3-like protein
MKRRLKPPAALAPSPDAAANADAVLQVKVWLVGISPMVWRRVLVPASFTLRELHGVIQVTMGWEGIHLYAFRLRAARYGSWELSASSPDVTLADLRFRKGARVIYEYDLNIPWRHEVRIEDRLEREARKTYPVCTGGDGACPPEDCGGPESFMDHRNDWLSFEAFEDLDTMIEVLQAVVQKDESEKLGLDQEPRWRLEDAVERARAREEAQGRPFSRRRQRPTSRRRAPHPHAPAVVRRSARRCASRSAASNAAASPCRCRMPEINAWAVGSVS